MGLARGAHTHIRRHCPLSLPQRRLQQGQQRRRRRRENCLWARELIFLKERERERRERGERREERVTITTLCRNSSLSPATTQSPRGGTTDTQQEQDQRQPDILFRGTNEGPPRGTKMLWLPRARDHESRHVACRESGSEGGEKFFPSPFPALFPDHYSTAGGLDWVWLLYTICTPGCISNPPNGGSLRRRRRRRRGVNGRADSIKWPREQD